MSELEFQLGRKSMLEKEKETLLESIHLLKTKLANNYLEITKTNDKIGELKKCLK